MTKWFLKIKFLKLDLKIELNFFPVNSKVSH